MDDTIGSSGLDTGKIIGHIKFLDEQISSWESHHEHLQACALELYAKDLEEFSRIASSYIRRLKGDRSEALGALERAEVNDPESPAIQANASEQAVVI